MSLPELDEPRAIELMKVRINVFFGTVFEHSYFSILSVCLVSFRTIARKEHERANGHMWHWLVPPCGPSYQTSGIFSEVQLFDQNVIWDCPEDCSEAV